MHDSLVPGRECGPCGVCCVALVIDDPALQKPSGVPCTNLCAAGCRIYLHRPKTCSDYHCGWKYFRWVHSALRPNQSGIIINAFPTVDADGRSRNGAMFSMLTPESLQAEGLAESVAAAVAAKVPVFLSVPGAPGEPSKAVRLNAALAGPVALKDKKAVLRVLRRLRKGVASAA